MVGLHRLGLGQAQRLGDEPPAGNVVPVHERDRRARVASAPGAPDPVDVDLLVLGALVVDDVGDVVHVDAAGGHVSGHEDIHLALAEGTQRLLSGPLAQVAVEGAGGEAARGEVLRHAGGGALGTGEDDGAAPALGLEDPCHHLHLVERVGAVDHLLRGLDRHALVTRVLGADVGGLGHVAACQGHHGAGHGGGEQHGVAVAAGARQDLLDVRQEAQVEHLVGLVQHHGGDVGEVQHPALHEVDEAAGSPHHHLDALLERLDLRLVGAPAVDLHDPHGAVGGGHGQLLGHLLGQLAGGQHHEALGGTGRGVLVPAVLAGTEGVHEQGNAEAEGLAGPGLGLADDVLALQGHREGESLDREGVGDAPGGQGVADLGFYPEVGEGLLGEVGVVALVGDVRGGLVQDGGVGVGCGDEPGALGGRGDRLVAGLLGGGVLVGHVVCLSVLSGYETRCAVRRRRRSPGTTRRGAGRRWQPIVGSCPAPGPLCGRRGRSA